MLDWLIYTYRMTSIDTSKATSYLVHVYQKGKEICWMPLYILIPRYMDDGSTQADAMCSCGFACSITFQITTYTSSQQRSTWVMVCIDKYNMFLFFSVGY